MIVSVWWLLQPLFLLLVFLVPAGVGPAAPYSVDLGP